VLILNLKRGQLVRIGGEILELIVIYDTSVYITYKGNIHRVSDKVKTIDSSLDTVFKRRTNLSARIGFSSPYRINRIE
jgi:hypothetical protein